MKRKNFIAMAVASAVLTATVLMVRAQNMPGMSGMAGMNMNTNNNMSPSSGSTDTNSVAAKQPPGKPVPYPLKYCVVSGDTLGEMGDPVEFVYTNNGYNQEIKFCCPMCKPKFLADPDKYMKIILTAEAAQKK